MADQVLTRDGPAAVPMDYQVPQGGELIPLVVNATLDGSAAASAFYGAVQIIAPSGRVMGSAITSSIAAGASASPTWFPGVGGISSSTVIAGQIVQVYWGDQTATDFTWTGPAATTVATNFPTNSTFTKLYDNTYLQLMFEGDFDPGAAADNLTLGVWLNGINRLNVAAGTVGSGAFSSVNGCSLRGIPGDPVSFPAGAYTVNMRVSSFVGQTTILRCAAATTLSITELGPV